MKAFHVALLIVLGALAYSNSLDVPFQFDDREKLIETHVVEDIAGCHSPRWIEIFWFLRSRMTGLASFALNYRIHGLDVRGYHVLNVLIHVLNAVLVYVFAAQTFRTPFLSASALAPLKRQCALLASLLFLLHPVQTEAVTYICQRFTSLAALFYMSALVLYIKWRLSEGASARMCYVFALVSALLAMTTKENAFTLPLAMALYEYMFFRRRPRLRTLVPFFLLMAVVPLTVIDYSKPFFEALAEATKTQEAISRNDYLLTQFPVILTYLRLLVWPSGQNLDYDYPIYGSPFEPAVAFSALLLFCLFGLAVFLHLKSRRTEPALGLVSFGAFWFFLTLSVESSVIALADVIFEHRLYLPSVGVFAGVSAAFVLAVRKRAFIGVVSAAVVIFALFYATHQRNEIWRSELGLWRDVVQKSPAKARAHNNLAMAYMSESRQDEALQHLIEALRLDPKDKRIHYNLGRVYLMKGLVNEAEGHFGMSGRQWR